MRFFRLLSAGSLSLLSLSSFFSSPQPPAQTNSAPQVRITSPADAEIYAPGALVPYTVTVSDKEDGESAYEEIPATEVFMELRYFSDPVKAAAFRKGILKDPAGYTLFKKGDCYNCHAVHAKVIGPSFSEIATRYKKPEEQGKLAAHIIKGSTGIWGTAVMPTHPDLSPKEAQQIVRWMLLTGKEPDVDFFRGAAGAFHLPPVGPAAKGFFLLKAGYTDHGTDKNGAGSLAGQDVKMLKLR